MLNGVLILTLFVTSKVELNVAALDTVKVSFTFNVLLIVEAPATSNVELNVAALDTFNVDFKREVLETFNVSFTNNLWFIEMSPVLSIIIRNSASPSVVPSDV